MLRTDLVVCIYGTGNTSPEYVRSRCLTGALSSVGARLVDCTSPHWAGSEAKLEAVRRFSARSILRFLAAELSLFTKYLFTVPAHDAVLVIPPGHADIPLARLGTWLRGKPLVFDAFYSLYDTVVEDRSLAAEGSMKARLASLMDRVSCTLPDRVLVDTAANRSYMCGRYGLDPERFTVIPAGAPEGFDEVGGPSLPSGEDLRILFHGSYVPLQGARVVAEAARILSGSSGLAFRMVGEGQDRAAVETFISSCSLRNIEMIGWLTLEQLHREVLSADICLGIFGTTGKASRVIPHKVYAALACGRPVITADTPAARELLTDGVDALLCRPGDPESLACCIERLASDGELRQALGKAGRDTFVRGAGGEAVSSLMLGVLYGLGAGISGRRRS